MSIKEQDTIFPYKVKRKIVIFGQRPAWSKQIKQCLIDVVIIDKDDKRNYDSIIENADIIWIHNQLSHNYYNKILKSTRKYKKEVKYFCFKGGQSCAKQIVDYEEKGEYINYLITK
jgi:hypothetical protein